MYFRRTMLVIQALEVSVTNTYRMEEVHDLQGAQCEHKDDGQFLSRTEI